MMTLVTDEDRMAVRRLLDALVEVNRAIDDCNKRRISFELIEVNNVGGRNPHYVASAMEKKERVLPL